MKNRTKNRTDLREIKTNELVIKGKKYSKRNKSISGKRISLSQSLWDVIWNVIKHLQKHLQWAIRCINVDIRQSQRSLKN